MMNYESIFIGVLSSVVASFLFFLLMFVMRPSVVISEAIARTVFDGRKAFVIKIVNHTWWNS